MDPNFPAYGLRHHRSGKCFRQFTDSVRILSEALLIRWPERRGEGPALGPEAGEASETTLPVIRGVCNSLKRLFKRFHHNDRSSPLRVELDLIRGQLPLARRLGAILYLHQQHAPCAPHQEVRTAASHCPQVQYVAASLAQASDDLGVVPIFLGRPSHAFST